MPKSFQTNIHDKNYILECTGEILKEKLYSINHA